MPGPPQQTTHGCHPERASMQRHMCKTFCWNATSFQILSTCQCHLTHLSDFRAIPRAPMVHQGMLIDWITVRPKTQFEEEVNKTTCPQQPVRLFDHFSPLAGDSAYLDLSETWVPQKSSCSLTKGPFWRTPNLETKPYLDLSIFATKSLQFWWSSQKSHPWQCWIRWMFGSQRAHEKMTGGSWLPCQHSTAAAHVAFQPPSFLDKSRRHFEYLFASFSSIIQAEQWVPETPWQLEKHVTELLGRKVTVDSSILCSNACSLSTDSRHSHSATGLDFCHQNVFTCKPLRNNKERAEAHAMA